MLGYVAALGGDEPGPCHHYSAFVGDNANDKAVARSRAQVVTDARAATPVDAALPVPDPPLANCIDNAKRVLPEATELAGPRGPSGVAALRDKTALVQIDLTDDGIVANASVYRSSGDSRFDLAAMWGAAASKYSGGRFHCRPAGGSYLYRADYSGKLP